MVGFMRRSCAIDEPTQLDTRREGLDLTGIWQYDITGAFLAH
jgi:hypothetical protein